MSTTSETFEHSMPGRRRKLRLGDLLVQQKILSEGQLTKALEAQKKSGQKLGNTLVELGMIDEEGLLQFLSRQLSIPVIDLREHKLDPAAVKTLPEAMARRYRAIVIEISDSTALVGMADPTNLFAFDEIGRALKRRVRQAVVREGDLLTTLDRQYRSDEEITHLAEALDEQLSAGDVDLERMIATAGAEETPVYRLLHRLFEDAVRSGASDIHIEPDEEVLRLRQRVDGVLHEQVMNERRIAPALVQRLKILSSLDIAEKRLPQDGRFHIKVKRHQLDVRLSTMPTQHGEAVVMRLLDQTAGPPTLDQLGMNSRELSQLRALMRQPHGLLLVTGPTGSGKTTTLYAGLHELNTPDRKIITIEDPVEYQLPRVNQVQINDKIGLNFANVLRTSLRQDPDVLLVGEMRDLETVEIGLRAAMTGHLVMSTLHTNSAAATVARLIDIGARGYLLASALNGVLAQRLVRKLCERCHAPAEPDERQLAWLESVYPDIDLEQQRFQRGSGCEQCNHTGYRGRLGVYELLTFDHALTEALRNDDLQGVSDAIAARSDYKTLSQRTMEMACQATTSLDEVIRVHGEV